MNRMIRSLMFALLATAGLSVAQAADEYNVTPGLTGAGAPLGLHGYDPVAFIDIGNRQVGSAEFTTVHDGVAYYFSSDANLQKFQQNPEKYLPQFGGFCAYGVSVGKKFDGNPRFAAVENGKLYVFLSEAVFNAFQQDRAGAIRKAESNWRKIRTKAATSL